MICVFLSSNFSTFLKSKLKKNVVPTPTDELNLISPCIKSISDLLMAKPNPVP